MGGTLLQGKAGGALSLGGEDCSMKRVLEPWWIFSPTWDLVVFLGSCLASLLALALGAWLGILRSETPDWTWVYIVLLVDVAHVWSTGFRVYFDKEELRSRPMLYYGTPIVSFLAGWQLYQLGPAVFWRVLAYAAVWHFVRQQYGWVNLYRRRTNEPRDWEYWLDTVTIYTATLFPLLWWHAHLPRRFWWFLKGDFANFPLQWIVWLEPCYWLILAAYLVKAVSTYQKGRGSPGKDTVVLTTWLCWYLGVMVFNSDYAFTVTNVLIHGLPYIFLVYWYRQKKRGEPARFGWHQVVIPLSVIWFLAYVEEMVWDRAIWHEHDWLFGSAWQVGGWEVLLVPLLATPQLTHYILDGFIWKRRASPKLDSTEKG